MICTEKLEHHSENAERERRGLAGGNKKELFRSTCMMGHIPGPLQHVVMKFITPMIHLGTLHAVPSGVDTRGESYVPTP